jgi:hypothetical protein
MSKRSSVEVAIRVRPMRQELNESKVSWEVSPTTIREKSNSDVQFTFERIYNHTVETATMYVNSVRDNIVKNVALGYNGTVFAYGQTGSGKSFTMLGDGMGGQNSGIVNMSVNDLFGALDAEKKKNPGVSISVFVTMLEIYNEQLRDLLSPAGTVALPLAIRENEHGVYVHNATKRQVKSAKECLTLIHSEAESRRVSAATAMNERSSRSHCLIRILVEKSVSVEIERDDDDDEDDDDEEPLQKKIVSTLNLVDLAGSERVAKTGATGMRMVEGGHINKSLTILTTVINRLTEGGKNGMTHVPYRDSKLTHLLKTAIGGNSFTTVFCCLTMAEQHTDESRSTLQFAARAKTIKNDVSLNEIADTKTKLRELETEIKKYKRYLVAMDIYLMSKKLKIKLLQEAGGRGPSGGGAGRGTGHVSDLSGQVEQMQMIIDQLTAQNEELLQRHGGGHIDPMFGVADDDEKRLLRQAKEALEQELRVALEEKQGLQDNLDELDELLKELEEENAQKVTETQTLGKKVKALEAQVASLHQLERSQDGQIEKLKAQVKNEEARMLERARGDEMLENLTKLHVEHQNLQIEHNTLIDMFSRAEIDKAAEIEQLNDQIVECKEREEDARVASNIQRMYLWRLLSVAALATHGKPIDPEETTGPVREHQVEAAVKGLTAFVSSRLSRPPGVIGSDGDAEPSSPSKASAAASAAAQAKSGASNAPSSGGDTPKTPAQPSMPSGSTDAELRKRISDLEGQLIAKDAQRDIIIDTKLKRIQDLVLRLHATNGKLTSELHAIATQNNELHEIIKKEPKLLSKLNKTNLQPVSEQDVLNRANFAPTPQRPFFHN